MSALFDFHIESEQGHVPTEESAVEWSTPRSVFDPLNAEFGFTLDVCASDGNAKCARYVHAVGGWAAAGLVRRDGVDESAICSRGD